MQVESERRIAEQRADVAVILTAHENERYVAQAVSSILAQAGVTAEIVLSDDASTDRTHAIMAELVKDYAGPHRVTLRRNARNLGVDHGLDLVELTQAEIIVMAHGDDIAEPQRCLRLLQELEASGAYAVTSNYLEIDPSGQPMGLGVTLGATHMIHAEEIARRGWHQPLVGATLAFRREVRTRFPRLDGSYAFLGHDTVLPFRGAVLGGMRYVHEPLVRRRRHPGQAGPGMHNYDTRELWQESQAVFNVMTQFAMARDLRHLAQAEPERRAELSDLLAVVNARLLGLGEEWMSVRHTLYDQGLRPQWVDRAVFAAANRRNSRPGLRERARALYRRLRWQVLHR